VISVSLWLTTPSPSGCSVVKTFPSLEKEFCPGCKQWHILQVSRVAKRSICREAREAPVFSESPAWRTVGDGWRPLHDSMQGAGLSFEWHDFETSENLDWGKSFHPGCVEMCLNLAGNGRVSSQSQEITFTPLTAGFYRNHEPPLQATRQPHQRHQFLTVEMSCEFLRRHLLDFRPALHPLVREAVAGPAGSSALSPPTRLTTRLHQILVSLREAPVLASAQQLWYQAKALELAAELFFLAPGGQELFCHRQQRLAAERVEKVIALLRKDLSNPPSLQDIGRAAGCSIFHLSRTFSAATGLTIPQYLRQLRMERAADLLRSGKFNVTEASMEVGYSSLSHFSQAFHETFGCCPGLYPLRTPAQKSSFKQRSQPGSQGRVSELVSQ